MSVRNPNVTIPSPDGQSAPPPAAPAVEPKARSTAKKATATKPKKKPAKKTTPRRKAAPAAKAQQAQTDGLFAELTADGGGHAVSVVNRHNLDTGGQGYKNHNFQLPVELSTLVAQHCSDRNANSQKALLVGLLSAYFAEIGLLDVE